MNQSNKPKLLLFDVNETLMDLNPMRESINKAFASDAAFAQWFNLMLQYSLVDTVTGNYHDFATIGKGTLRMLAQKMDKAVDEEKMQQLLGMIKELPPHPDVVPGLQKLKQAGYRLAALTNSAPDVLQAQMQHAKLSEYFEQTLSIDAARKYKPHPDAYAYALKQLGVAAEETMMVAAHGWDITGALAAGLQAAFVSRPGHALYPLAPAPQLTGPTLESIAAQLINQ